MDLCLLGEEAVVVVAQVVHWSLWLPLQGMWATLVVHQEVGLVTVDPRGLAVTVSRHLWSVAPEGATLLGLGGQVEDQQVEHMDKEVDLLTSEETISSGVRTSSDLIK